MTNEIWKIRVWLGGWIAPTSRHDNAPSGYLKGLMGHENRKAPDSNYRRKRRLRSPLITVGSLSSGLLARIVSRVLGRRENSLPYSVFKWNQSRLEVESCQESA